MVLSHRDRGRSERRRWGEEEVRGGGDEGRGGGGEGRKRWGEEEVRGGGGEGRREQHIHRTHHVTSSNCFFCSNNSQKLNSLHSLLRADRSIYNTGNIKCLTFCLKVRSVEFKGSVSPELPTTADVWWLSQSAREKWDISSRSKRRVHQVIFIHLTQWIQDSPRLTQRRLWKHETKTVLVSFTEFVSSLNEECFTMS